MIKFARPKIFASKCLGFATCRWNGVTISSDFVESLKPYVDFVTACPEVEIGLGVPRDPIRVVTKKDGLYLFQPATGRDVTGEMKSFARRFLDSLGEVDGFILKDRSPSCGLNDVKVYPSEKPSASVARTHGFFGAEVLERYAGTPAETEARLTNYRIREHFLAAIFILAGFRDVKRSKKISGLTDFHARNKFLLMSYSQKELAILGRIAANRDKLPIEQVLAEYELHLKTALKRPSRYASDINILTHALGYFKEKLSSDEKKFFLQAVEGYRSGKIPLSVPSSLVSSYIVRFGEPYLESQAFFTPYPQGLVSITDSGKGR